MGARAEGVGECLPGPLCRTARSYAVLGRGFVGVCSPNGYKSCLRVSFLSPLRGLLLPLAAQHSRQKERGRTRV